MATIKSAPTVSSAPPPAPSAAPAPSQASTRAATPASWWLVTVGLVAMYGPTLWDMFQTLWLTDNQGHGPIVLAVVVWLFRERWPGRGQNTGSVGLAPPPNPMAQLIAWALLLFAAILYALGRSQNLTVLEAGSAVPMLVGIILLLEGPAWLRALWFPLFFLCFLVPLPPVIVDTVTQPMKLAVSYVAEQVLELFDYPIARSGVILQVGPYQLLVADACAGLQTLFTLEAMGLLYLNVVRHSSWLRNVTLAILIVPISFTANVIRVIALILITYHFGDEAGQGFLHGFAGMVLFMSSLLLIISADTALRAIDARRAAARHSA